MSENPLYPVLSHTIAWFCDTTDPGHTDLPSSLAATVCCPARRTGDYSHSPAPQSRLLHRNHPACLQSRRYVPVCEERVGVVGLSEPARETDKRVVGTLVPHLFASVKVKCEFLCKTLDASFNLATDQTLLDSSYCFITTSPSFISVLSWT